MRNVLARVLVALAVFVTFSAVVSADTLGVGILSFDPNPIGAGDVFDIQNLTGPIPSSAPPSFPIATPLTFDTISLTLTFSDSSTSTLGTSDFTSDGFGGFQSNGIFDTGGASVTSAVLTGTLSPVTVTLDGGGTETLDGTFSATLTDPSGTLMDFDAVTIDATGSSGVTAPESSSGLYLGIGVAGLLGMVWKRKQRTDRALIEA